MPGGGTAKGPNPNVTITPKTVIHQPNKTIVKDSDVGVGAVQTTTANIKIALLILANQDVAVLAIKSKNGTPVPVSPENQATKPVSTNAAAAFPPLAGQKWAGFIAKYQASHGKKFDTHIELTNFDPPANGFQAVTLIFAHDSSDFRFDPYFIANSVLPAQGSTFMVVGPGGGGKSPKKKPKKAPAPKRRGRSRR